MALAVILVQGGIREVMQAQGSVWELKLVELLTTIMGGGLLGGCIALILDRIKKSKFHPASVLIMREMVGHCKTTSG